MLRRFSALLLLVIFSQLAIQASNLPPELERALKLYRAEGAPNWAFVQTTAAGGQSLVEHYDPAKPEFSRWTLLEKNGTAPSEADTKEYREQLSRRTSGATAPNLKDQIDLTTCERVSDNGERANYRFRLAATEKSDRSAAHMQAVFTLHKPTGAIERVELSAFEPFSPMFLVKINEVKTIIVYNLPTAERPTLLQSVTVHMRGSMLWFKSLDEDMTVTYSAHTLAGTKPSASLPSTLENPARPATPSP